MDDAEIIGLFFERDEKAIEMLDKKYGKLCHKIAMNILSDSHYAEECVNDAYLGVWNTVPPKEPNPLSAFTYKIVRNIAVARYHKNTALKRNSFYDAPLSEIEESLPSRQTVDTVVEGKLLTRAIEAFLDTLDEENRVIFLSRYWMGDSYDDIAQRTGISVKNVSVRLVRLRQRLKEFLLQQEVI